MSADTFDAAKLELQSVIDESSSNTNNEDHPQPIQKKANESPEQMDNGDGSGDGEILAENVNKGKQFAKKKNFSETRYLSSDSETKVAPSKRKKKEIINTAFHQLQLTVVTVRQKRMRKSITLGYQANTRLNHTQRCKCCKPIIKIHT